MAAAARSAYTSLGQFLVMFPLQSWAVGRNESDLFPEDGCPCSPLHTHPLHIHNHIARSPAGQPRWARWWCPISLVQFQRQGMVTVAIVCYKCTVARPKLLAVMWGILNPRPKA